ncbi:HET-domain-containing protein [Patellaria atrata CBS 101060]|uniref:HET-domain-containing protein n=1 Tax=Patellaria atrata CBS 101060 TaxID=1346257 RepID=A0A9P4S943_9PEZI|nr:HET-domain-containing protein [Patellaria atrata CBS 101060]
MESSTKLVEELPNDGDFTLGKECERCQTIWELPIFDKIALYYLLKEEGTILHRNSAELVNGIQSRCWWCMQILHHMKSSPPRWNQEFLEVSPTNLANMQLETRARRSLSVVVIIYSLQNNDYCEFVIRVASDRELQKPSYRTDSQEVWKYITGRIKNCESSHEVCRESNDWVPTRLIEIGREGTRVTLRLVSTSENRVRSPYTTLSHRWGNDQHLKLTKQSLAEYSMRIPVKLAPRKYIDAVECTIKLGIQYLWIDSLCIIQDSAEDWDYESGLMDLIYQNSFCNIAATCATNSLEGLFYDRDPTTIWPHRVHLSGRKRANEVTRRHTDILLFDKLDEEPLYRRGWVCQERLLARRNISFTKSLVYFECAEELSSEILDCSMVPSHFRGFRSLIGREDLTLKPDTLGSLKALSSTNYSDIWQTIVEYYSNTQLTIADDKLVAISGVARVVHQISKSSYLAGLWNETLERDLAWGLIYYPKIAWNDRAPSWSWARFDAPLRYNYQTDHQRLVEFIDAHVTPSGTNLFGQIKESSLRLTGWMFPIGYGNNASDEFGLTWSDFINFRDSEYPWVLRNSVDNPMYEGKYLGCSEGRIMFHTKFDTEDINLRYRRRPEFRRTMECYMLPLFSARTRHGTFQDIWESSIYFLLIEAIAPSKGIYQRIGMGYTIFWPNRNQKLDESGHLQVPKNQYPVWEEESLPQFGKLLPEELPEFLRDVKQDGPFNRRDPAYRVLSSLVKRCASCRVPSQGCTSDGRYTITII